MNELTTNPPSSSTTSSNSTLFKTLLDALKPKAPVEELRNVLEAIISGSLQQRERTVSTILSSSSSSSSSPPPTTTTPSPTKEEPNAIIEAIGLRFYSGIGTNSNEEPTSPGQFEDVVCSWLYDWLQSGSFQLTSFVYHCIPFLLWSYVVGSLTSNIILPSSTPSTNNNNNTTTTTTSTTTCIPTGIEAVLLCMLNLETETNRSGNSIHNFNLPPQGGAPSIFLKTIPIGGNLNSNTNNSTTSTSSTLTEAALRSHNKQSSKQTQQQQQNHQLPSQLSSKQLTSMLQKQQQQQQQNGTNGFIDIVHTSERQEIIRATISQLSDSLPLLSFSCRLSFCKVISRIVSFGFPFDNQQESDRFPGLSSEKSALLSENFPKASIASTGKFSRRMNPTEQILSECISGLSKCCNERDLRDSVLLACNSIEAVSAFLCLPQSLLASRSLRHVIKRLDDEDASTGNPRTKKQPQNQTQINHQQQQQQPKSTTTTSTNIRGKKSTEGTTSSDEDEDDDDNETDDDENDETSESSEN